MLSKGEQLLREISNLYFKGYIPSYNKRPSWLLGMELDVYYPEAKIAFEFQGEQHFGLSDFNNHSFERLKKQIFYDKEKIRLCSEKNITLIQVGTFELTPSRFQKTIIRYGFPNKAFLENLGEKAEEITIRIRKLNEEYRSYNDGRKCMSMKNTAARLGYLENIGRMNPRKNRFKRVYK